MAIPNAIHPLATGCRFLWSQATGLDDLVTETTPTVNGTALSEISTAVGPMLQGNSSGYLTFGNRADIATPGTDEFSVLVVGRILDSSNLSGHLLGNVTSTFRFEMPVSSANQQLAAYINDDFFNNPAASAYDGIIGYNNKNIALLVVYDGATVRFSIKDLTTNGIVTVNPSQTGNFNSSTDDFSLFSRGGAAGQLNSGAAMHSVTTWDRALTLSEQDDVLDDPFVLLASEDSVAPTLSGASATATGSSTATGSVTTDEASSAWAVLTTSATAPTAAQVKAGQNHTGAAAAASDTGTLVVGANASAFSFTGLTASTAYYMHVVADDAVPNTATVVSSSTFSTPAAPLLCTVTLYEEDGTTPAASITGLQWAWWDDATPDLSLAADVSGTGASTSAGGVFSVTLTGTALTLGQTGTLLIYKTDGTAESTATLAFCGPLATVN